MHGCGWGLAAGGNAGRPSLGSVRGSGGRSKGEPATRAPEHRLKSATQQEDQRRERGGEGNERQGMRAFSASHRNSVRGHRGGGTNSSRGIRRSQGASQKEG